MFQNEEPAFNLVRQDPVPSHPRPTGKDVAEADLLARAQGGVVVNDSKAAGADVDQAAADLYRLEGPQPQAHLANSRCSWFLASLRHGLADLNQNIAGQFHSIHMLSTCG